MAHQFVREPLRAEEADRLFGPISGHDAKIDASRARYVATAFCYGCNQRPSQTDRSLEDYDRRQLAWVDQRHVTVSVCE
jgi:hypothetical protein